MNEINKAIIDAIEKMHNYLEDKGDTDREEIKLDVAIANTTTNLAKAFFSGQMLMYRVNNAEIKSKETLKEIN